MNRHLLAIGDKLFRHGYPAYLPLYSAYKAIADRKERALMRDAIRPGATIVDIGANIGVHARFLSQLCGNSGRVYAFEPSPTNFARLKANVAGSRKRDARPCRGRREIRHDRPVPFRQAECRPSNL